MHPPPAAARSTRRPLSPSRSCGRPLLAVLLAGTPLLAACRASGDGASDEVPLFEGLGSYRREISTTSEAARRYFDQGLVWTHAFNHDEAIRSFEAAARHDPRFALAHWGIALCHGPHINNPAMDEQRSRAAWEALQRARQLAGTASPVERDLIIALGARYADPSAGELPLTFEERAPLDRAYADAMTGVARAHPDDPDVGALYAEALMDLRPWDLWGKDGEPRPETTEVVATLERVLARRPDHPLANHLYIHAVEASREPARADQAADRLRTLVPGAGHLVHMPAHIDVRTGRWAQAAEQNRQAAAIDDEYRRVSPHQGFYRLYMAHNDHFLSYACMMEGRREEALSAARDMLRKMPAQYVRENAGLADAYAAIEIEALVRFGLWEELLRLDAPPEFLPITTAFWRFGRASAHAARGELEQASSEQARFREAVAAVPAGARMANNAADSVLSIADNVLAGELAFRHGDVDQAVARLSAAAAAEDGLSYIEPPDWIQPVRHALGAVLVAAGRMQEAEAVYRADLERWPENGWSLYGLARCLEQRGAPEAAQVRARFERAFARADVTIASSCLCVPAAAARGASGAGR